MNRLHPITTIRTVRQAVFFLWIALTASFPVLAEESIIIHRPVPYQVVQRQGFEPRFAHDHHPGGPVLGSADVRFSIAVPETVRGMMEYRLQLHEGCAGQSADWTELKVDRSADLLQGTIRITAGGWYRLEIRVRREDTILATGSVDPISVGDVFLIAGQSYATNCNDEQLRVQDPQQRVVAYHHTVKSWQVAHDPQPAGDASDGGSIWPAFGDLMLPATRVPVGLVNVAVGATATGQWMPDGPLHQRLVSVGSELGDFRAVLWQQGESDVIAGVSTSEYVRNMVQIQTAAEKGWDIQRPWLLAKSTLHPTVYNNPEGEAMIREAIDQLCELPAFNAGPDTDILSGSNRGPIGSRRHFTGIGQKNAAVLWFAAVWQDLNRPRPVAGN